ncbi:MAG: peptidase S14 [Pseudomonadota bacterium]
MTRQKPASPQLPSFAPDIRLFGQVNEHMLGEFFRQQHEAPAKKPLVLELSTQGGNADIGRRIALELQLWQQHGGRELYFFGKSFVYSAGVTIMSAFPVNRRFITSETLLLIHERKLKKTIELNGALRGCLAQVNDVIAEIESGQMLEREGFAQLVNGTLLTLEQLEKKVLTKDWYLTAQESLDLQLVGGLV